MVQRSLTLKLLKRRKSKIYTKNSIINYALNTVFFFSALFADLPRIKRLGYIQQVSPHSSILCFLSFPFTSLISLLLYCTLHHSSITFISQFSVLSISPAFLSFHLSFVLYRFILLPSLPRHLFCSSLTYFLFLPSRVGTTKPSYSFTFSFSLDH